MFVATTLAYPCVLVLLCFGAGLLTDRVSGGRLAGGLLPAIGAATLIGVSQLTTYISAAAPATPYVLAATALAGFAVGWPKLRALSRVWRSATMPGDTPASGRPTRALWQVGVAAFVYVVAMAPVLAAGRPTFSSFQALTDSAFHMLGADYLMHHGQDYAGLDLKNSYGQYLHNYYATAYPSGADTFFGGSSFLVGLPLIWAFQPFNAFMLATAAGPAWTLARRMGLAASWAALATATALLGALVYGYELVSSVKEVVALAMILTLGALTVQHARWLWRKPAGVVAFALVLAAGVSALGVGFGAWGLAAVAALGAVAIGDVWSGRHRPGQLLGVAAIGAAVFVVSALDTLAQLQGSLEVAHGIATTGSTGNLTGSLEPAQVFGTWLAGSYQKVPTGVPLVFTYAVAAVTLVAAVFGSIQIVSSGERALAGWIALTVAAGIALSVYATAWVSAKAIMLTSPVVLLLAWAGIAGLRASVGGVGARRRPAAVAALAAIAIVGGVAVSDAMQYHNSNLAPTARYEELAKIERMFAGKGPTLWAGFDEYTMYELRRMDVGGLDFTYPPVGLRMKKGHGYPIDLDRISTATWSRYPLVLTRRDPTVSEPPSAYRLVWQGTYYQVWERRPGSPAAIVHLSLESTRLVRCARVARLAQLARSEGARLIAAAAPETVSVNVAGGEHQAWRYTHPGLVMSDAGRLRSVFTVPYAGVWDLWLKGEFMPTVKVSVDGRAVASIGGELDGNAHNPEPTAPMAVRLSAGRHVLTITKNGGIDLAPGAGGWAILHEAFLTPAGDDTDRLVTTSPDRWQELCGKRYDWIEAVRR